MLQEVDDWHFFFALAILQLLLRGERKNLVDSDRGAIASVLLEAETTNTDLKIHSKKKPQKQQIYLPEVTRVVFVHVDAVLVHATGITATTRMFAVLSNTSTTHTHMPTHVARLALLVLLCSAT